jgi:hypothetical protein
MALIAGDEVAYLQPAANADYYQRNGDFEFGVVTDVDGSDVSVLWANGNFTETVLAAALDKIEVATSAELSGRVVSFSGLQSPEFLGIVLRVYSRDPNDGGSPVSFTLIRLRNGQLIEVPTATVQVANGQ